MQLNSIPCISLASHHKFKMAAMTGYYENTFIRNFVISQPILSKFALKKSDTFTLNMRFHLASPQIFWYDHILFLLCIS